MSNIKNRRGGFYWVGGEPFVSVTTVLGCIAKPALRWWFGKEVYLAMVKDPTLSQKEALSAPWSSSSKAKSRGSTVHSIVEVYKKSGKILDSIPEQFKGYAEAFYSWIEDNHVEVLEHERTVVSKKYGFAGTLDLLVKLNGGGRLVVDVKTGKAIYPEAFLQLSAYKQALSEEGIEVKDTAVLLLKENGKYAFEKGQVDLDVFLAAKRLWLWLNREMVEKIGGEK